MESGSRDQVSQEVPLLKGRAGCWGPADPPREREKQMCVCGGYSSQRTRAGVLHGAARRPVRWSPRGKVGMGVAGRRTQSGDGVHSHQASQDLVELLSKVGP